MARAARRVAQAGRGSSVHLGEQQRRVERPGQHRIRAPGVEPACRQPAIQSGEEPNDGYQVVAELGAPAPCLCRGRVQSVADLNERKGDPSEVELRNRAKDVVDDRNARAREEIAKVGRRVGRAQEDCGHRDSCSFRKMDRAE